MWYSRISKLATSSISKKFTYKNHPTLNQNACFSSLVGSKAPSISSKNGYTNYSKNLLLVKHYHNSGVDKWYKNILGTPKRTFKYYQQKLISSPRVGSVSLKRINYFLFYSVLPVLIIVSGLVFVGGLVMHVSLKVCGIYEKIPYTNRSHIVFAPPFWDKMFGDGIFERMDLCKTLSEEHPDSVRVKMIGEQIVEALESDLKAMNNQNVSVDHLRGFIWKFIVVDDPTVTAYGIPGGKIFVTTGLLKKLESDAEIATIIGHQVGHNVARHIANRNNMRMPVFNTVEEISKMKMKMNQTTIQFRMSESKMKMVDHNPHGVSKWVRVLFQYPRWRRQQSEADDIGLLLMASAGYDPQAAPKVYEIFETPGSDFYDEHPSGKKRAKKLSSGKVMKEAKSMYSKVIETRKMIDLKDR